MSFQTVGISIGLMQKDLNITSFEEFNDHSYILSYEGAVLRALEIVESQQFRKTENPAIFIDSKEDILHSYYIRGDIENDNIPALSVETDWEYSYTAQIIMDKQRGIAFKEFGCVHRSYDSTKGLLFNILWKSTSALATNTRCILRIVRYPNTTNPSRLVDDENKIKYVDIPVCGCAFLYDNHKRVNGYPWKEFGENEDHFITNYYSPKSIEFVNGNVKCIGGTLPETEKTDYKWVEGDECKVIIDDNTIVSYYFHNGKWVRSY